MSNTAKCFLTSLPLFTNQIYLTFFLNLMIWTIIGVRSFSQKRHFCEEGCYSIIISCFPLNDLYVANVLILDKLIKTGLTKNIEDWTIYTVTKRYSKIDQHLARHSKNNVECLSSSPPFLCSQIITPFSHSMISTNQKTGL